MVRKIWEPKRKSITLPQISACIFSWNASNSCLSHLSRSVNGQFSSILTLLGFHFVLGGASIASIAFVQLGSQISQQDRISLGEQHSQQWASNSVMRN